MDKDVFEIASRSTIPLFEAVNRFSDEQATERMFIEARWPNGVACPFCGSLGVKDRPTRKPAPFRCYDCHKDFSVKTGTIMHSSNLSLSTWALATYLLTTNPKGIPSLRLAEYLGVTQKTAWHLAHRIRRSWEQDNGLFAGPVEVDEFIMGLGMPHRLRELEIPREDLRDIAEQTMEDGTGRNNPMPINSVEQVLEVLEKAW